jgi:hypothetical protein
VRDDSDEADVRVATLRVVNELFRSALEVFLRSEIRVVAVDRLSPVDLRSIWVA